MDRDWIIMLQCIVLLCIVERFFEFFNLLFLGKGMMYWYQLMMIGEVDIGLEEENNMFYIYRQVIGLYLELQMFWVCF